MAQNNAINAANSAQSFGNASFALPALASGTTSNVVYYGVGGVLTQGAAPGGTTIASQKITTAINSGTFTRDAKCVMAIVEIWGGGGGGGGTTGAGAGNVAAAGGGGGGAYCRSYLTSALLGPTFVYTIGAAGVSGTAGGNGGTGGNSSTPFSTAQGGVGGGGSTATTGNTLPSGASGGGAIGTAAQQYLVNGGFGGASFAGGAFNYGVSGAGGDSVNYAGGSPQYSTNGVVKSGQSPNGFAAGGSGATNAGSAGGAGGGQGGAGLMIVTEFLSP